MLLSDENWTPSVNKIFEVEVDGAIWWEVQVFSRIGPETEPMVEWLRENGRPDEWTREFANVFRIKDPTLAFHFRMRWL